MKIYKKRAQKSWSKGKEYKADSNRRERRYEQKEIQEQIDESEKEFRHKTYTRTPNEEQRLLRRIRECERWLKNSRLFSGALGDDIKRRLIKLREKYNSLFDK